MNTKRVSERSGRCLCGAVSITARSVSSEAGACHCGMCRRWGGGPLMAVDCGTDVSIEGEDRIGVYDSSEWAERGFCTVCGTHLFYRLKQGGQLSVPVGVFDDNEGFDFRSQIFIDQKPSYYSFANETADMTEAEVFAKYGPA